MSMPPDEALPQTAAGGPRAEFVPAVDSDLLWFETPKPSATAGIDRFVLRNPTAALLAAAGLGFLAGRLLR
jgi:hypothetical protein